MDRHVWRPEYLPPNAVSTYRDLIGLLEEAEAHIRKLNEMIDNLNEEEAP